MKVMAWPNFLGGKGAAYSVATHTHIKITPNRMKKCEMSLKAAAQKKKMREASPGAMNRPLTKMKNQRAHATS
jgi:hypothetical protein